MNVPHMPDLEPKFTVAVAFPKRHEDRERLRQFVADAGLAIPQLYPDGVERPCQGCGIVLDVGPRVAAASMTVWCPPCAIRELTRLPGVKVVTTKNLGNPESKPEEPHG